MCRNPFVSVIICGVPSRSESDDESSSESEGVQERRGGFLSPAFQVERLEGEPARSADVAPPPVLFKAAASSSSSSSSSRDANGALARDALARVVSSFPPSKTNRDCPLKPPHVCLALVPARTAHRSTRKTARVCFSKGDDTSKSAPSRASSSSHRSAAGPSPSEARTPAATSSPNVSSAAPTSASRPSARRATISRRHAASGDGRG